MLRRALAVAILLAGCVSTNPPLPTAPAGNEPALPDVIADHDHRDDALHSLSIGLSVLSFTDAATLLGDEGARLSDIQFFGHLATVVVNGRAGTAAGGFFVLDVTHPESPMIVSRYRSGSEDNWYTKFSPDGRFVFLTANGNTNQNALLNGTMEDVRSRTGTGAARGIQIVDVSDPSKPRFAGFFPAPVRAINLATWAEGDTTYVAASIIQDRVGTSVGPLVSHDLNYVSLLRFDENVPALEEVARWQPDDAPGIPQSFPHDLDVEQHPISGARLLFAAYWDAGGYIVDVTDPTSPTQRSRIPSLGAGDHIHSFKPHPDLIDGRHYAVLAPETFAGEPSGTYRSVDVTDPASPIAVANWTLPPGDLRNAESLLFSPHEFELANGRVYTSNYHAGAWILEVPRLRPTATWQATMGTPSRTGDWSVDIETVVPYEGVVWAIDMGSGVLGFKESG